MPHRTLSPVAWPRVVLSGGTFGRSPFASTAVVLECLTLLVPAVGVVHGLALGAAVVDREGRGPHILLGWGCHEWQQHPMLAPVGAALVDRGDLLHRLRIHGKARHPLLMATARLSPLLTSRGRPGVVERRGTPR